MKHCMPPQGPAPTRAKQIPLPLPPTPYPPAVDSLFPPPSEMCFPFYHSVLCGGQEPLSGSSGGSGPPLAADAEPISPAVDPGSREVATAAGAALLRGGGGRTWVSGGGRAQRGSPGGVWWCLCTLVPGGRGGGMLPCPALPAAGWLHGKGYGAMCGVRAVPWGGGVTPVQPLGSALGLCPPPSRVQPPSRVCPVL